jgi:hypothetical protein
MSAPISNNPPSPEAIQRIFQGKQTNNSTPPPQDNLFPEGFLALHAGLQDHLQQGRMTPQMLSVFIVLLYQVEWSSGRWNGNSHRIHFGLGGRLSIAQIRRTLRQLQNFQYIRRFQKQGLIGNYFVLINKYRVRVGELRGMILNSTESTRWETPKYEPGSDKELRRNRGECDVNVTRNRGECEAFLYQEEQDSKEGKIGNNNNIKPSESEPDVVDAVPPASSKPSGKTVFLTAQHDLLEDADSESIQTTRAHREEAWRRAQEVGAPVYLGGLARWLDRYREELELGKDGEGQTRYRTWALQTFLESPNYDRAISEARPFVARFGSQGGELTFLANHFEASDPALTPENLTLLRKVVEQSTWFALAGGLAHVGPERFFADPQAAVAEWRRSGKQGRIDLFRPASQGVAK